MTAPVEPGNPAAPTPRVKRSNGAGLRAVDPSEQPDDRPLIRITVGAPSRAVDAAIAALAIDSDLFERDCALVHVTRATHEEAAASQGAIVADTPKIHEMHPDTLRERMCSVALWERVKQAPGGADWAPCEPSNAIVGATWHRHRWAGIRPLRGIIETPLMRPDGTILDSPGYDRVTGYLYAPSAEFLPITEKPTRDEARGAYTKLAAIFDDFPYSSPAGQSMAVAAILTVVGRTAIVGACPAFLFDATSPGSGKTLQSDVVSAIATGRDAARQHFPFSHGRDGDAELQKVLATIARRGAALVNFDNLDADKGVFGGAALEQVVTARDSYSFRILGKTEDLTVAWKTVVIGSGNNVDWSRDMGRRLLVSRIESPLESPENRPLDTYKHPEHAGRLFEHALDCRAEFVHAALTLLRAYVVAGCPDAPRWGSFEAWARLVAGSIVWAGGANPMACRPSESGEESDAKTQHRVLVTEWDSYCRSIGRAAATAKEMIAALYPGGKDVSENDPMWNALRGAIEHFAPPRLGVAPDPAVLGKALRSLKGSVSGSPPRKFVKDGETGSVARWRVELVHPKKLAGDDPLPEPELPFPIAKSSLSTPFDDPGDATIISDPESDPDDLSEPIS